MSLYDVNMAFQPLRIGFLASHNGTDMQAIINAMNNEKLFAVPTVIISNNGDSPALAFAKEKNIHCAHISKKTTGSWQATDQAILHELRRWKTDIVVLSGYMQLIGPNVLSAFPGKIFNVHPALPDSRYLGKDYYGDTVHAAVLAHHEKTTGAFIHIVTEKIDEGKVLAVARVAVKPNDTVVSLRKRVQSAEKRLYLQVLQSIIKKKEEVLLP